MTKNASGIDFFTAILLVTSITTFFIWLTCKKFKKTDNHTVLKLELTNGKQCVMLDILTLPMCPRYYHPKADNYVSNFLVGSFIRPKLLMNWNGLNRTNMITNTIFEPSTSIYINPFMSARIKKTFSRTNSVLTFYCTTKPMLSIFAYVSMTVICHARQTSPHWLWLMFNSSHKMKYVGVLLCVMLVCPKICGMWLNWKR